MPNYDAAIWTLRDVMAYTGLGKKAATALLNRKGCPLVGKHTPNTKYLVRKDAFIDWLNMSAKYF